MVNQQQMSQSLELEMEMATRMPGATSELTSTLRPGDIGFRGDEQRLPVQPRDLADPGGFWSSS
jgi:hypothetical protein